MSDSEAPPRAGARPRGSCHSCHPLCGCIGGCVRAAGAAHQRLASSTGWCVRCVCGVRCVKHLIAYEYQYDTVKYSTVYKDSTGQLHQGPLHFVWIDM